MCICGRLFYARSFCVFCEFRGRTLRSLTICVHLCASVGGYSPPEASVYSVNSVGGLAQTNLEWVLWKEFGGRRGYGSHKTIFPQNSRNTQKRLAEKKNLCTSVKSVGGSSPPEASVYSVNSVGGLAQTNLEWVLWKEFGGLRGYGILPYPRSHQTIFPQNSRNTQKRLAEKKNLCTSVKSVGGSYLPEGSVGSACSVGDSYLKLCWCSGDRCTP